MTSSLIRRSRPCTARTASSSSAERAERIGEAPEGHGGHRTPRLVQADAQRPVRLRAVLGGGLELGAGGIGLLGVAGLDGVDEPLHGADHRIRGIDPHRQNRGVLLPRPHLVDGDQPECQRLVRRAGFARRGGVEGVGEPGRNALGEVAYPREARTILRCVVELRGDRGELSRGPAVAAAGAASGSRAARARSSSAYASRTSTAAGVAANAASPAAASRSAGSSPPATTLAAPTRAASSAADSSPRSRSIDFEGPIGGIGDGGIGRARDLRARGAAAEDERERRQWPRQPAMRLPIMAAMDLEAIRRLPKAELHQHLDGSVRPATAVELADAIGMPLTLDEATRRMVGPERCADQAELLTFFDLPIALLQTAEALERAAAELVEDLAADGVRYAEVRWAPRLHLQNGLSVADVIEAVAAGVARGASAPDAPAIGLIVTAIRSHPPAANAELARTAGAIGHPVVGFDLAGPEAAWPAPPHAVAFVAAREVGLALTAHAGEVAGAERVREVLDFGVRRVAHGVTAAEDPALLDLLRARDITLDLCPDLERPGRRRRLRSPSTRSRRSIGPG